MMRRLLTFMFLFICGTLLIQCDNADNPSVTDHMVTWLDPQSTEAEIYKENMGVLKIEYVANNHKANWPNTAEYSIPTKEGYLFVGWDFDWENTPIIQDTDIHAIWMKGDPQPTECISAVDNSGIDHPIDGDDDLGLDYNREIPILTRYH